MKKRYDRPYHEPPPPKPYLRAAMTKLSPKALTKMFAPMTKSEPEPEPTSGLWFDDVYVGPITSASFGSSKTYGTFSGTAVWPPAAAAGTGGTLTASSWWSGVAGTTVSGVFTSSASWSFMPIIPLDARRAMQEAIIDCSVLSLKRRHEA